MNREGIFLLFLICFQFYHFLAIISVSGEPEEGVYDIDISPDGKYIAVGRNNHKVTIFDYENFEEIKEIGERYRIWTLEHTPVAFSPDGKILASGRSGNILLWNTTSWDMFKVLTTTDSEMRGISFSPDGKYIAGMSRSFRIWDLEDDYRSYTNRTIDNTWEGAFSADSKKLFIVNSDGKDSVNINVYNPINLYQIEKFTKHRSSVIALAVSVRSDIAVSTAYLDDIRIWNQSSLEEIEIITGMSNYSTYLALSSNDEKIAFQGYGNEIVIYDLVNHAILGNVTNESEDINQIAFSLDNEALIYGTWQGSLKKVDLQSFEIIEAKMVADLGLEIYFALTIVLVPLMILTILKLKKTNRR